MKKPVGFILSVIGAACLFPSYGVAQKSAALPATATVAAATSAVPRLVSYSGVVSDLNGQPLTSVTGVTFLLYKDSQGGSPLWMETQSIHPDKTGHYSVTVGSTTTPGLPADVFVSGEARWLGVQIAGQPEQARVLLVAVPYALKAGDAETIGGLPPSAFLLAAPATLSGISSSLAASTSTSAAGVQPALTGTGTTNFIPLWTSTTALGSSALFQSGTGTASKIGINTITPASPLDVNGGTTLRGPLNLVAMGTATAGGGKSSQFETLTSSAFNSSSAKAVNQNFRIQAEAASNNTANATGSLNFLFGSGTTTPVETGLKIGSNGVITFAPGQTFGGGGGGTITAVVAGTDLKGGGTSGSVTLNLDTTKVPQLASNNSFTGTQTVVNSNATGAVQVTNPTGPGVAATTSGTGTYLAAVSGVSTDTSNSLTIGVSGTTNSSGGYGIYGAANTSGIGVYGITSFGIGVIGAGASSSITHPTTGVYGFSNGPTGIGVYGYAWSPSAIGNPFGAPTGIWADTSGTTQTSNHGLAALTTADDGWSIYSVNASTSYPTTVIENWETTNSVAPLLLTYNPTFGGLCTIDAHGDLGCSGSKSAVVPVENGAKQVALYAVEAPENWFEDAGSGALAHGSVVIRLEKTFSQTVNTDMDYHVFLTPNGDCKGLYVTKKTANSFEVHELGGGKSSIAFDYRIMARRKGYEDIRLADKTKTFAAPAVNRMRPAARQRPLIARQPTAE